MYKYSTFLILLIFLLLKMPARAQHNAKITGQITNFEKHLDSANSVLFLVHNIISYDDIIYRSELTKDGSFSKTFIVEHTQDIYLEYRKRLYKILISPGNALEIKLDAEVEKSITFSGKGAKENDDLKNYQSLVDTQYSGNWNEYYRRAKKDSTPNGFKQFILNKYASDVKLLDQFLKQYPATEIFKNWAEQNITYDNAGDLMDYFNALPDSSLPIRTGYFDYKKFPINNPQAIVTSEYGDYLSAFKENYIENRKSKKSDEKQIIKQTLTMLLQRGSLTTSERASVVRYLSRLARPSKTIHQENTLLQKILEKHPALIPLIMPTESADDSIDNSDNPILQKDLLKTVLNQTKALPNQERITVISFFKSVQDMHVVAKLLEENDDMQISLNWSEFDFLVNTLTGISRDIISSMLMYEWVDWKSIDIAKQRLAAYKKVVKTDFIKKRLLNFYAQTEKKLLTYTLPQAASFKNVPTTVEDSFFYKLIEPYKGKVLYIDFWATWCAPCRANMPFAGKLKEHFKGEDVVFIYLATSSPKEVWKAVIAELDIRGEHFSLTDNEYNLLAEKFQINGIPHYVLVDKGGKIKDGKAKIPQEESLKSEITELLKLP